MSPGRISGRKWEWDPWDGFSIPDAEEGLVCPSPGNNSNNIFSCCFISSPTSTLGQQRAGKVFGALGSCGLGFARLLGDFHWQRGCSGLPFSRGEPALCSEDGGEMRGEQRDSPSPSDGLVLLGSGTWHHLVTQGLVPNLLLSHPKPLILVIGEPLVWAQSQVLGSSVTV